VERFSCAEVERVADLLAYIHRRGVLTCDPAPENFIRLADGRISFIDFGRAKVMKNRGGRYLYHLGKELARVEHHTFSNDRDRYARFYDAYKKRIRLSRAAEVLVYLSCRAWAARWTLRQRLRERRRC
jgi:tRNA A-37 threonylcarbamoyl transferase component Bud32